MLQFDGRWRFDSPGPIEAAVQEGFRDLINRVCGQGQRKAILEHFKARFCAAANTEYWPSTNERFASEDLDRDMARAETNAPVFIEAFWDACQELRARNPAMVVPDAGNITDGARLEVDLATGLVRDVSSGCEYRGEPVPAFLLEIVADGGLLPNLHKRLHGKPSA